MSIATERFARSRRFGEAWLGRVAVASGDFLSLSVAPSGGRGGLCEGGGGGFCDGRGAESRGTGKGGTLDTALLGLGGLDGFFGAERLFLRIDDGDGGL